MQFLLPMSAFLTMIPALIYKDTPKRRIFTVVSFYVKLQ